MLTNTRVIELIPEGGYVRADDLLEFAQEVVDLNPNTMIELNSKCLQVAQEV